jgi:hypothetical protein
MPKKIIGFLFFDGWRAAVTSITDPVPKSSRETINFYHTMQ